MEQLGRALRQTRPVGIFRKQEQLVRQLQRTDRDGFRTVLNGGGEGAHEGFPHLIGPCWCRRATMGRKKLTSSYRARFFMRSMWHGWLSAEQQVRRLRRLTQEDESDVVEKAACEAPAARMVADHESSHVVCIWQPEITSLLPALIA